MVERDYNFLESVTFGLGSGVGWAIAIMALAGIEKSLSIQIFLRVLEALA